MNAKDAKVGMHVKILSGIDSVATRKTVGKVGEIDSMDADDCCLVKFQDGDPWYYYKYDQIEIYQLIVKKTRKKRKA
jgi:hypothetical protein